MYRKLPLFSTKLYEIPPSPRRKKRASCAYTSNRADWWKFGNSIFVLKTGRVMGWLAGSNLDWKSWKWHRALPFSSCQCLDLTWRFPKTTRWCPYRLNTEREKKRERNGLLLCVRDTQKWTVCVLRSSQHKEKDGQWEQLDESTEREGGEVTSRPGRMAERREIASVVWLGCSTTLHYTTHTSSVCV